MILLLLQYWPDIGSFKISVLTKALIICWTYMLGYVIVGRLRWWTYLPQTYLHTLTTHDWVRQVFQKTA